mgnify:CR=1 FL=1
MANKVEFGISNLHIGTYTVSAEGVVTMGTPITQPGAISLSLDPEEENSELFADNTKFWSEYSDQGFSGSVNVAKFSDEFKKAFLGYVELADGGIAKNKYAKKPEVYIAFQAEGDAEGRRMILYNVTLGGIQREFNTTEATKTPDTETINMTVVGDNTTGLTKVGYTKDKTGYNTLFTNPPKPTLPSEA